MLRARRILVMGASLQLHDDAFPGYERVFCLPWTACDVILLRQISQYLALSASRYGMRVSTVHAATWPRQCGEIRLDQPTNCRPDRRAVSSAYGPPGPPTASPTPLPQQRC